MTLSHVLPEFGAKPNAKSVSMTDVSLEEQKLNSFEAGYRAGWDDSTAANRDAGHQVSADFAQNMADLSLTYQEAYAAVFTDIRPLITQIIDAVLPDLARETLAPRIFELIEAEMSGAPDGKVVISAAPDACTQLTPMLNENDADFDVAVREDTTLSSGQVRLSFDDQKEQELDTAALVEGIQAAVHSFFQEKSAAAEAHPIKETA